MNALTKESIVKHTQQATNLKTWRFLCMCKECNGAFIRVALKDVLGIAKGFGYGEYLTREEWETLNHKVVSLNKSRVAR
jgi:hypothetical protein